MNLQSNLALKFSNIILRGYAKLRHLINSLISWSPFLTRIFNETLRIRRWRLFQSVLIGINYEPEVRDALIQFLKPGMTMIDAGANIGYYTLLAARAVGPQGHVYAFEPVPAIVESLRKNVKVNRYTDRVTIIPKALTSKGTKVRIFLDHVAAFGTIASMFASDYETGFVDVEGISLDEFFSKQTWPPIHIIKMDIEGAEKLALDGMRELSRRNPELKLIVEVNLKHFSLEEFVEALQACGFSRFYLLDEDCSRVVSIPDDPSYIISEARRRGAMNLLCEKAN